MLHFPLRFFFFYIIDDFSFGNVSLWLNGMLKAYTLEFQMCVLGVAKSSGHHLWVVQEFRMISRLGVVKHLWHRQ